MAGNMLEDRDHPPFQHTVDEAAGEIAHHQRIRPEAAVADGGVGRRTMEIEHRGTEHVDPQALQIVGDQPAVEPGRLAGHRPAAALEKLAEEGGCRPCRPMRRLQALDPAAFLGDQHRRVGAPDGGPERPDQGPHLVGRLDVAAEQDEAERVDGAKEVAFLRRQDRSSAAE